MKILANIISKLNKFSKNNGNFCGTMFPIPSCYYARAAYLSSFTGTERWTNWMDVRWTENRGLRNSFRTFAKNRGNEPEAVIISKVVNGRKAVKRINEKLREAKGQQILKNIENAIEPRRIAIRNTKRKIQEKGKVIMQDIKETKNKIRGKLEEIVERENVYTIPNFLCITRIGLSPLLGYLIISENFHYALAFMFIAGISDWFDGWVARTYKNQSSKIGSFLDPMADKVLIGTLFVSLTYVTLIPVALTALVISRDIVMIISGFVVRYRSLPPPRTFSRYFDVTLATAQLAPTFISKVNTGIQLLLVGTSLAAPIFGYINHFFLHGMWYLTTVSTIAAAGSYIFSTQTYRYLKKKSL